MRIQIGALGHHWKQRTPAMAAGLADHRWTIYELLHFKVPKPFCGLNVVADHDESIVRVVCHDHNIFQICLRHRKSS